MHLLLSAGLCPHKGPANTRNRWNIFHLAARVLGWLGEPSKGDLQPQEWSVGMVLITRGCPFARKSLMATQACTEPSSPVTFSTFICQALMERFRGSVFTEIFGLYDLDNTACHKSPRLSLDILKTDETADSCFLLCMQMINYRWEIGKRRFYSFAGLKQTGLVSEQ